MKMNRAWKIRLGALCLTGLCLGTGAALAAGDADDPLVTLSYLNETVLPKLLSQTDEKAKVRQTELPTRSSTSQPMSRSIRCPGFRVTTV